jgi:quercetin dioxygenase-like cupin family protein
VRTAQARVRTGVFPWGVVAVKIVTVIPAAALREAAMSTTEDLSSGASGKKVQQAPGLWVYILEGSLEYQVEGHPPRMCNVGEALIVPAGALHAVRNVCSGNAAELDTYLVGKGKPVIALAV